MKRVRTVYLSKQIIAILKQLQIINGRSVFVFQGRKNGAPLSENSINHALRNMGYDTENDVCLHGFRTMMVSGLRESKNFIKDAIELHIGHEPSSDNKVGKIYGRDAEYHPERKALAQWWADYLDALKHTGYVHPIDFKPPQHQSSLYQPINVA